MRFEKEKEFKKRKMPQYVYIYTMENLLLLSLNRKPPIPMATRFHHDHASLPGYLPPHSSA